jgi:hypothetical protein
VLSEAELETQHGPVIRTMCAGESFGELALLQKGLPRTASVAAAGGGDGCGPDEPALLIRISRRCYDQTVRSLQVGAGRAHGLLPHSSRHGAACLIGS